MTYSIKKNTVNLLSSKGSLKRVKWSEITSVRIAFDLSANSSFMRSPSISGKLRGMLWTNRWPQNADRVTINHLFNHLSSRNKKTNSLNQRERWVCYTINVANKLVLLTITHGSNPFTDGFSNTCTVDKTEVDSLKILNLSPWSAKKRKWLNFSQTRCLRVELASSKSKVPAM